MSFIILDWSGQPVFGRKVFNSWDDAEEFLVEFLMDHETLNYENDRGEYNIVEYNSANFL